MLYARPLPPEQRQNSILTLWRHGGVTLLTLGEFDNNAAAAAS